MFCNKSIRNYNNRYKLTEESWNDIILDRSGDDQEDASYFFSVLPVEVEYTGRFDGDRLAVPYCNSCWIVVLRLYSCSFDPQMANHILTDTPLAKLSV